MDLIMNNSSLFFYLIIFNENIITGLRENNKLQTYADFSMLLLLLNRDAIVVYDFLMTTPVHPAQQAAWGDPSRLSR